MRTVIVGVMLAAACTEVASTEVAGTDAPSAAPSSVPTPAPSMAPSPEGVAGTMATSPVVETPAVAVPDAAPPSATAPHAFRVSLVDHARWTLLAAEEDPFEDRPAEASCAAEGVAAELLADEPVYGVDTGACSYLTARQASREDAAAGETIVIRLWHFALDAPSAAEAHAALELDGVRLLDERVPIPSDGGLIRVETPLDRPIAAGSPLHFHLHNHGANSWALVEVSVGPR